MTLTVGDLIARPIPLQGPDSQVAVTIRAQLICTTQFAYLADSIDDQRGILIAIGPSGDTTPVFERLIQCAPVLAGSYIAFNAPSIVSGLASPCVLPMFPRLLHSLTEFRYDGSLLQQTDTGYILDPPLIDDREFEFLDPMKASDDG